MVENVFVGLHGARVATSHPGQVDLGLEADLHHVRGLGERHSHGPCGAAGQDTDTNICSWDRTGAEGLLSTERMMIEVLYDASSLGTKYVTSQIIIADE